MSLNKFGRSFAVICRECELKHFFFNKNNFSNKENDREQIDY